MKKLAFLLCLLFSFIVTPLAFSGGSFAVAQAETSQEETQIQAILEDFIEYDSLAVKNRSGRYPGSDAEKNSALYIHEYLSQLSTFKAVENVTTKDGLQSFEFDSNIDNLRHISQNVIFIKNAETETDKKVIIAAHYDSAYLGEFPDGQPSYDAINDNAGAVALLLNLASQLDKITLPFNVEIVFFGASTNNYAGSKFYSRVMDQKTAENTLLMINLDRVALGNYTYMYVNEYKSSQQNYFNRVLEGLNIKQLDSLKVMNMNVTSPNGLNYTHIGLESDHAIFMTRNINVLFFFGGYYEDFLTTEMREYEGQKQITYSAADNYENLLNTHADFISNLARVQNATLTILSSQNFVVEMEKDNGSQAWYKHWTNDKLAVFITAVLLVVFIFIYFIIYTNLQKKSRESAQSGVNKIVLEITKNLGEDDDQLTGIIDKKIKDDTDKE